MPWNLNLGSLYLKTVWRLLKEEKLSKAKNETTSKDMVKDGDLMSHKLDVQKYMDITKRQNKKSYACKVGTENVYNIKGVSLIKELHKSFQIPVLKEMNEQRNGDKEIW